jgi:hypothetical protein
MTHSGSAVCTDFQKPIREIERNVAMSNQFGPWATMIGTGGNLQLGAFWRRRMAMLVGASQTRPFLSRRNLLCLLAAAALMIGLPTFRLAAATDPDQKPAAGDALTASADDPQNDSTRQEKKLSQEPEKKREKRGGEAHSDAAVAAERAYEVTVAAYRAGKSDIEAVYRWSCRWMQAEMPSRGPAAVQSHINRMRVFCEEVTKLHEEGAPGGESVNYAAARYYVLEAKETLQQRIKKLPLSGGKAPVEKSKPAESSAAEKLLTPRAEKEIEQWKRRTWQLTIRLDSPNLDPPAVQYAVFDNDPLPAFDALVKKMSASNRERYQQAETDQLKEIQRTSGMTVDWDMGFKRVTGNQLYVLTPSVSHQHRLSGNGPDGKKWIVTKTVRAGGKVVCWCLPVEVKKGESVKITLSNSNAFDLEAVYDKATKEAGENKK